MSFDLSQLTQGPLRDVVLSQLKKNLNIPSDGADSLLTKGLGMVLGGMAKKSSSVDGVTGIFDMIKNTEFPVNPLEVLTGKTTVEPAQMGGLMELGKNLLPAIFGTRTSVVEDYLTHGTGTTSAGAKSMLAMLLPLVISFFKSKITGGGLNVASFTQLLGEQAQHVSGFLDQSALSALGVQGSSQDLFGGLSKVTGLLGAGAAVVGANAHGASATAQNAVHSVSKTTKSSPLWKWLTAAVVILAALLGYKSCTKEVVKPTESAPVEQPATPVVEVKEVDGLGNLAWVFDDKELTVSGDVQNEGIKTNILDGIKKMAAGLPVIDKLNVDEKTAKFKFNDFAGLFDIFSKFPGVSGKFEDSIMKLTGAVNTETEKTSLVDGLKFLFNGLISVNADEVKVKPSEAAEPTIATAVEQKVEQVTTEIEEEAAVITDMSLANIDLNIHFDSAKSDIKQRYNKMLNAFAHYLIENNKGGEIVGYTDNSGKPEMNLRLSEDRANAVRNYLIAQGVNPDSIIAIGYGQEHPRADNSTEEGRAKNRRIEFNAK